MSIGVKFSLTESVGGFLSRLRELADSETLNKALGLAVSREVKEHLNFLDANSAHKSARSLGARPSGHYAKAASAVEFESDAEGATIVIPANFGLSRAFGQLEITPKNGKKWLTIPAHRSAYGRSAKEFDDLNFVLLKKDLAALFGRDQGTGDQFPMFWLKPRVTIPQDRDILPTDEVLTAVAEEEAENWVQVILSNAGGLN